VVGLFTEALPHMSEKIEQWFYQIVLIISESIGQRCYQIIFISLENIGQWFCLIVLISLETIGQWFYIISYISFENRAVVLSEVLIYIKNTCYSVVVLHLLNKNLLILY